MAATRTPRTRWIEQGLRALSDGGPDAVRVEALAQALGVSKGGFYWHFSDRRALLDEMLASWEELVIDGAIQAVEAEPGDARVKLRRLFELAAANRDVLRVELAIRDWARRDPPVAARLARVDDRRMDYMRSLFGAFVADADEVEVRCLITFSLFIGEHFIAAGHGESLSRADVLELALRRLLE